MNNITSSIVESFLTGMSTDPSLYHTIIKNDLDTHYKSEISIPYKTDLYSELQSELLNYSFLEEDWDGYEAIKPPVKNIEDVKLFISILKFLDIETPNIMLSCAGDISLYWELNEKYMELNFNGTDKYSYLIEENSLFFGKDNINISDDFPNEVESFVNKYISKKSINRRNIFYVTGNTSNRHLIS